MAGATAPAATVDDFAFLTGWDAALMPMLLVGCDGGTNATSGVVPEITRKLYDLTLSMRLDEARQLQYRLLTLFDAMILNCEFPEGFRHLAPGPATGSSEHDPAVPVDKVEQLLKRRAFGEVRERRPTTARHPSRCADIDHRRRKRRRQLGHRVGTIRPHRWNCQRHRQHPGKQRRPQ